MTDAVRRELPRSMLGRYRLICELGSGGMAHVFLALATGLAGFTKLVVLKVMRGELAHDSEAQQLFLAEARLAARLNHPNVVQTLEVGEDAGCYFISMEYLEGLSLGTLLGKTKAQPLPLAARLEIACQMLDGLSYLHELQGYDGSPLGLVHRDISPSNVFFTFEGITKVLDFGVAKAAGLSNVSVVGSFKGKFGYAAPEQLRGRSDARSDVFAAGLLLWEMLAYRRLGRERTASEIVRGRGIGADADLMRSRGQGLPPELLEVCIKAAAIEPDERYQSAAALRAALRSFMLKHSFDLPSEQLRLLLSERFDVLRQAERKRVEQRLKEIERQDAEDPPGVEARPNSQTPQAFAESSQHVSVSSVRPTSKTRHALTLAAGVALVSVAAFVGATLARRGAAFAPDLRGGTASAVPGLRGVERGASIQKAQPDAPVERGAAELDVDSLPAERNTSAGRGAPKLTRPRAEPRSSTRARPAAHGSTQSTPGASAPQGRKSLEATVPAEPPDFVHARPAAKVARPIDSVSPYLN